MSDQFFPHSGRLEAKSHSQSSLFARASRLADPNFNVMAESYPCVMRRLCCDNSPEGRALVRHVASLWPLRPRARVKSVSSRARRRLRLLASSWVLYTYAAPTSRAKLEGNRSTGLPREKECCPANPGSAPRLRTVLQAGLCSPPTDGRQKMIAHVEQNASEPRIAPPRALRRSSHRSTAASARRAWALSALSAPLRLRGGRPEQVSPPRVSRWARPSSFWSRRV